MCVCVVQYPDWLADKRPTLADEEYERYNRQFGLMRQVCEEFEAEQPSDMAEVKQARFERVLSLMQKVGVLFLKDSNAVLFQWQCFTTMLYISRVQGNFRIATVSNIRHLNISIASIEQWRRGEVHNEGRVAH